MIERGDLVEVAFQYDFQITVQLVFSDDCISWPFRSYDWYDDRING
jgi:hypothetical protein